jgi:hypothetical protein
MTNKNENKDLHKCVNKFQEAEYKKGKEVELTHCGS